MHSIRYMLMYAFINGVLEMTGNVNDYPLSEH